MIDDKEIARLNNELRINKVDAIVVNKIIQELKNQQRHIFQLRAQLQNCQGKCRQLRGLT